MNIMQNVNFHIESELQRCKELHYRFSRRLGKISVTPVFETMSSTVKNGKRYYSETWLEGGRRRSKYLGDGNNPEVISIKEKYFLRKALIMLEKHILDLENSIKSAIPFNMNSVNESLPKVYQLSPAQLKLLEGPSPEEIWYSEALKEKEHIDRQYGISYAEQLTQKAADGTLVRSKSEVAICNEFAVRRKLYIYEMPSHIGPFLMHPDFTFYSNRLGKVLMWEHIGKLGDVDYMSSFSERMDRYIRAGFVPCVDILFTFDTIQGDLDMGMIKTLLDKYE